MQDLKMSELLMCDRKYYFEGYIDGTWVGVNNWSSNVAQNKQGRGRGRD